MDIIQKINDFLEKGFNHPGVGIIVIGIIVILLVLSRTVTYRLYHEDQFIESDLREMLKRKK